MQLYSGILRKSNPIEFLTQSVSLFRLYYRPGDMEVVYEAPGTAVLRLVGFSLIWLALAVFTFEALRNRRRELRPSPAETIPA